MSLSDKKVASFWEHLDVLRATIWRIAGAVVVLGSIAFCFKEELFAVILAPGHDSFVTYRLLNSVTSLVSDQGMLGDHFAVKLINTELAQQFIVHVQMSMYAAVMLIFPYIMYEVYRFVAPALYRKERRYAFAIAGSGYIMFIMGVALSYFLIFPLTFRFLGTYQVSPEVENMIGLDSYVGTMMMLNLMMGIVFELPILSLLFAKFGLLSAGFLRKYRRHAIVILLTIAAIITPTSDVVTLLLVSLPMYLLYEVSILIVAVVRKREG